MPKMAKFYSVNEAKKPVDKRVHHDNDRCGAGISIPDEDRRPGEGPYKDPYRLCEDCEKINKDEAEAAKPKS
jgi:hypothetical protein